MARCWNCKTQVSSREETCPVCDSDLDERTARREQKKAKQSSTKKSQPAATSSSGANVVVVCVVAFFACAGLAFFGFIFLLANAPDIAQTIKEAEITSKALPNMGVALMNFESNYKEFPPYNGDLDSEGNRRQSWMTSLLPYLDQGASYNKLNFKTTWNDPINREIMAIPFLEFRQPPIKEINDANGYGLAHYAGNSQFFNPRLPVRRADIKDGLSNSAVAGTVNAGFQPWGDPKNVRDLAQGIGGGPHAFGSAGKFGMRVLMADGSVRQLGPETSPDVIKALANPNDGR